MKINNKHKYDIDIKLVLDEKSKNTFDKNFVDTYNIIVNSSINSLSLTNDKINEIVKFIILSFST